MARKAVPFIVTLIAWLIMATYGHGVQTASAQGSIPQKHLGDFVIGTNQVSGQVDNRYTLTVTQNITGDIELYRVIPQDPQDHSFNTYLLAGSYKLLGLGQECVGYLDENRTNAEFDYTQKFAMIFNGTPVTVNPAAGSNAAWIWFECKYSDQPENPNQPGTPTISIFMPLIQTAPAEIIYPLAGLVYTGTVNSVVNPAYTIRWLNNGELEMVIPTNPQSFSVSLVVWKGKNFLRLRTECELILDESLTGDPWNHPSQTLSDDGAGISFNVTPKTGNEAWAIVSCEF
jgi:hypothetical protein